MMIRIGTAPRVAGTDHAPQNHAVLGDGGRPLPPYVRFDACSEIAFNDLAAMHAACASDHDRGAVKADKQALIDPGRLAYLLAGRRLREDCRE